MLRGNELHEEGLYGLFVNWMVFNLNCGCSGVTVVTNSIYVGSNALEGYVYARGSFEDCLELVGQGNSLKEEEEPASHMELGACHHMGQLRFASQDGWI